MSDSPADAGAPTGLRRGECLTVTCERMVHGGLCIAHHEGNTLMVDGGIPGEAVDVVLQYRKGRTWFGAVSAVRTPSAHRTIPPCPHVPDCGGCQLQHVGYQHQLSLKRDIVLDAMRSQRIAVPELRIHSMVDPWSYRWRGEFHVVPGERGVADAALGFNRARSWRPIAIDDCLIHHRRIRESLPLLRDAVRAGGTARLKTLHLTVGEDGSELLVNGRPAAGIPDGAIDTTGLELPERVRWSREATTLNWRGHTFRVTPGTFIQVNWTQMDVLYGCVLDALGTFDDQRIVDAYAGIGVLSAAIAERAGEVICIEGNPESARIGMLNAQINGLEGRLRFVRSAVEDALAAEAEHADAIVLDPPRAGCDGRVTGWLALAGPPCVIYVSCDPATLARDLHVLAGSGPYRITGYDLVDMFPHTHHIESVVTLRRVDQRRS